MKKFYTMALALTVVASAMAAPQIRQMQPNKVKKHMRVYQNEGLGTPSIFKLPENRMNWRDPIFGWISGIFDSQGV